MDDERNHNKEPKEGMFNDSNQKEESFDAWINTEGYREKDKVEFLPFKLCKISKQY
jgi:hypothetical protein